MSDRSLASEGRSIRINLGDQRLLIQRNATRSTPFCIKARSKDFLTDLMRKSILDPERVFKGSYNQMVFLNNQETTMLLMALVAQVVPAQTSSGTDDSQDEDVDDQL